jgi:opacity protein-like surface antigen
MITIFLLLAATGAGAQTIYDGTDLTRSDLTGTARFVGMGGAMSALGGDLSTMGTNPAGIGIYRSNDAAITFGYSMNNTDSKYDGNSFSAGKNHFGFDQAGFVFSTKVGNLTSLRYLNFGFNYHKRNSLYKNMTMQGMMGTFDGVNISQVHYMAQQASDFSSWVTHPITSSDIFEDAEAGWLGALGVQSGYVHNRNFGSYVPSEVDGFFISRERGGVDQYDFNMSMNFNDRVYLGLTLNAYDVNYDKYALWDERYATGEGYAMNTYSKIKGSGFGLQIGAIVRPFETSPLRIGLAIHTPAWYRLTYTTGALMGGIDLLNNNYELVYYPDIDTYDILGGDANRDYELQTPWLFNLSLGYTIGSKLAVDAEYEYEDYSSMGFKYPEGDEMEYETGEAKANLKGVHTLRAGLEYKPTTAFALRLGYNYSTTAYQNDAMKWLPQNSLNTDTDFTNTKAMQTFTAGLGYRGKRFYADLAYKLNAYKADFYPFFNEIATAADRVAIVTPAATEVSNLRHQVLLTLGIRF